MSVFKSLSKFSSNLEKFFSNSLTQCPKIFVTNALCSGYLERPIATSYLLFNKTKENEAILHVTKACAEVNAKYNIFKLRLSSSKLRL